MTLIVGLKSEDCIVIGAEQEESGGIAAKRIVSKLKLITGSDWAVIVGGAGDATLVENAMRAMERKLQGLRTLTEEILLDVTDRILDSIYTKYVDKDKDSEGFSLVIGAVCGKELHLISTIKRVPQQQDFMAYAGIGADIGIFFIDRLHRRDDDWTYAAKVAGFTLQQATEACRYCGGESEIYVLQRPPNPRWRSLGTDDAPNAFFNEFQIQYISRYLADFIKSSRITPECLAGYRDEQHLEPVRPGEMWTKPVIPLEFFPSAWLQSPSYQKQIDEICSRNRDRLLQLGLLSNPSSPDAPASAT